MIHAAASMLVQFGTGTASVGCNKLKSVEGEPDQWYIKIHATKKFEVVGQKITNSDIDPYQYVMLTFPTEEQMIKVMAAFTNKTYEEVQTAWVAAREEWSAS